MIRSGATFNPMRQTPPPPPYIDTFELNPEDYLSVMSADDYKFLVHRNCLCVSPLIRKSLADRLDPALPGVWIDWEDDTGGANSPTIYFPTLVGERLEVVIQYLYYKHCYEGDTDERPPFPIPVEAALEIMKIADVLQC